MVLLRCFNSWAWIACFVLMACSTKKQSPEVIEEVSLGVSRVDQYPNLLSEWNLFQSPMSKLKPAGGRSFTYTINAPLFSDYAQKERFIMLPDEGVIAYDETEVVGLPEQAILVKNFYYSKDLRFPERGRRLMETRLLIHEAEGWEALVYQWEEDQSDARRILLGARVPVEWTDTEGRLQRINYTIPSQPQCKSCHDRSGKMSPIGPVIRQLNKNDQLNQWAEKGFIEIPEGAEIPKIVDYTDQNASLDHRARAWMEVNCAHCHRKEGPAKNSGLYLLASQRDPYRLGVNKPPIAAGKGSGGLKYSIVPGDPDRSILVHRIESLEPGEMMPELGRQMMHTEGVALIRAWIEAME